MKSNYKKTFLGSIITFFMGISCCWLSSLVVWFGGATLMGTVISFVEDMQLVFFAIGGILVIISLVLYFKRKKVSS